MKDSSFNICGSKISIYFVTSIIFSVLSIVLLVISFSSSHWLESYTSSFSDFVRLGLWNVCFRNYRHPTYHIDHTFDGCNGIFSYKYQNIRVWLQPGWFICVQALMSCGLVMSFLAVMLLCLLVMHFFTASKVFLLVIAFILEALSALLVFLAICIFGSMCFDRSWIQYPNYNHLSWSYGLATVTFILEGCASCLILAEAFHTRKHMHRRNIAYTIPMQDDQ